MSRRQTRAKGKAKPGENDQTQQRRAKAVRTRTDNMVPDDRVTTTRDSVTEDRDSGVSESVSSGVQALHKKYMVRIQQYIYFFVFFCFFGTPIVMIIFCYVAKS